MLVIIFCCYEILNDILQWIALKEKWKKNIKEITSTEFVIKGYFIHRKLRSHGYYKFTDSPLNVFNLVR